MDNDLRYPIGRLEPSERLTEEERGDAIAVLEEAAWAELPDARSAPIASSLDLYEALHARWVELLRALGPQDFARSCVHPEWGEPTVDFLLGVYEWHARHHTAHVTELRKREGW